MTTHLTITKSVNFNYSCDTLGNIYNERMRILNGADTPGRKGGQLTIMNNGLPVVLSKARFIYSCNTGLDYYDKSYRVVMIKPSDYRPSNLLGITSNTGE